MLKRATTCLIAATLFPLSAAAQVSQAYSGVLGSRLLNDVHLVGDGGLFVGFVNDTVTPLRVSLVELPRDGQGFVALDMPAWIPAHSAPLRADERGAYARAHPELHALGLDFAPFPQPGQGRFGFRRELVDGRWGGIWAVDPFATVTYHLAPEGPGAGPDSGVDLTLHTGSSGYGGFDYRSALLDLGAATAAGYALSAGIVLRELARIPGGWAYRWSVLELALHDTQSTLFGLLSRGASTLGPFLGGALLLGEVAYYTGVSASGGTPLIASTHGFVRLGGAGVLDMPQRQTVIEQVVRSPDGRYEYSLSLLALPYATGGADEAIVPDASDALVMLGVRRVRSAEDSCSALSVEPASTGGALLRGRCRFRATPTSNAERDTALDLALCAAGSDIANRQGRLDCDSRFSGPFEASFRKFDGNLPGAYTYENGELRVYAPDGNIPVVLARLRDPGQCAPGSIRYRVVTRELKQFRSLSCDAR